MRVAAARGTILIAALGLALTSCASPSSVASDQIVIRTESPATPPLIVTSETPTTPPISIRTESATATPQEGLQSRPSDDAEEAKPEHAETPAAGRTLRMLDEVAIKGRAPKTGYARDQFGSGWKDPDRNGCDARNDILRRDLDAVVAKPGTGNCVVAGGLLKDPYTGAVIEFTRGQGTSSEVQIDHVVALSDAWQKGAQQLDSDKRVEFANDPLNLLAVDGPANMSKGDKDAASWLPPQRATWCSYVTRQIEVKHKYSLWMTAAEHARIKDIVSTRC